MSDIRERRRRVRREALEIANSAMTHLYTPSTKSDDQGWICDRIREMADVFEADLVAAEAASLGRRHRP